MRKDIDIPEVSNVFVAAVYVHNESFNVYEWNVYLINDLPEAIENILVVSKGGDEHKATSVLRKQIKVLPAKSFAKLEYLPEDLLHLENQFLISFFRGNQLLDKRFTFPPHLIAANNCVSLPIIPEKGVLAK